LIQKYNAVYTVSLRAMNSLSARLPQRRAALVAICGVLFATAAAVVPVAQVTDFTIQCYVNGNSFGAILLAAPTSVLANGAFSYIGTARHLANGTLAGSATVKLSGKFVSSSKATGTASFSKAKQAGCPGKAFTATVSKT
jgi:hypothetical protein